MKSIIAGAIALLIQLPIWYYIVYYILTTIQASELVMFLFWIYVPVGILVHVLATLVKDEK